ncbi:UDP-glucose 4-epimerase GalE [Candidatus Nitrosacidococcus tergens]|uniref:UDP-glucose 4-epimerase n=1 Tax=Candidatus Nitrosacidococcus tergens TaxID=553981 RepID=A0A7G1Q7U8_9GAMM|nr:UDP-glucose 4-epimerase GalE [Candidatus Nitrosacidococcus tergens]CAB1274776.1 UDP-glucose 4-epimerase [Candidatus Nitrosacidococcus tergens]
MEKKGILVTGGAGYIGSHVVLQLAEAHPTVVVLDNLSTGFADAVIGAKLIIGDVKDKYLVKNILKEYSINTVLHFAAHTIVPESVSNPLKYYANNTCATRNFLECCVEEGVKNFVFSSTAATYGIPPTPTVTEDTPTNPINPYGSSKLMSEWMLRDLSQATHLNYVILRYFNVAGSDPKGRIGQSTQNATLLIKAACEVAVGKRENIHIFGVDYSTLDGTGIRDYIHVEDLAKAHLLALDYLRSGGQSIILNCGYGHGYSVREVLDSVQRVYGKPIKIIESPRRPGDPPQLIAIADKIRDTLKWVPQCDNLDFIVKTSLDWERKLLLKDH